MSNSGERVPNYIPVYHHPRRDIPYKMVHEPYHHHIVPKQEVIQPPPPTTIPIPRKPGHPEQLLDISGFRSISNPTQILDRLKNSLSVPGYSGNLNVPIKTGEGAILNTDEGSSSFIPGEVPPPKEIAKTSGSFLCGPQFEHMIASHASESGGSNLSASNSPKLPPEDLEHPNTFAALSNPEVIISEGKETKNKNCCHICNLYFKNYTQLKSHIWKHTGAKPFSCDICHSSFTQQSNLKTHQRIHTGERPFKCTDCGATFTQVSNLKTHMKTHTGDKPYLCDICDSRFSQQSNLKSHRLIHTGERPYACDMCDSTFVQSTHLRNHKRIHTDERPYGCEQCGSKFRQLSNLKTHEKTHTGEKPYMCKQCGSAFAQKSNLKAHQLKVHGIENGDPPNRRGRKPKQDPSLPIVCEECGVAFSAMCNLKSHMRLHTGEKPFECPTCLKLFTQKSNLKTHLLTHSSEKPFPCPYCPSCFKQKSNLKIHRLKKHPEIETSSNPTSAATTETVNVTAAASAAAAAAAAVVVCNSEANINTSWQNAYVVHPSATHPMHMASSSHVSSSSAMSSVAFPGQVGTSYSMLVEQPPHKKFHVYNEDIKVPIHIPNLEQKDIKQDRDDVLKLQIEKHL